MTERAAHTNVDSLESAKRRSLFEVSPRKIANDNLKKKLQDYEDRKKRRRIEKAGSKIDEVLNIGQE